MTNLGCVAMVVAVLMAGPPAAASSGLPAILHDYDAWLNAADPIDAASRGNVAAAALWPDDLPAAVAARTAELRRLKAALSAIPMGSLQGEDLLNARVLQWRIDIALQGSAFDEERMPFSSDEGFLSPHYMRPRTRCFMTRTMRKDG